MSGAEVYADYLTAQILRGDITVEQARGALLEYHYRNLPRSQRVPETLAETEDHAIEASLERNEYNFERTAKELGICRTTLYRRSAKARADARTLHSER